MDNTRASSATITGIFRYPVKGLTPEPLPRADLKVGETLRSDRRYAIENGPSGFDPSAPKWLAKPHFLMLQRDEWLAPLRAHFDDGSHVLVTQLVEGQRVSVLQLPALHPQIEQKPKVVERRPSAFASLFLG